MTNHPFNKSKFSLEILRWKNRINALPKSILLLFLITFISIVIIEFWLINIPAPVNIFSTMGVVYLKICYSFFSAFSFYFLVVHIFCPRWYSTKKEYAAVVSCVWAKWAGKRPTARTIGNSNFLPCRVSNHKHSKAKFRPAVFDNIKEFNVRTRYLSRRR